MQPISQLEILLVDASQHLPQCLAHSRISVNVYGMNDWVLPND